MEQRRPRLGDILDDYCPRERRVTNHVIVAMVADEVKQTRCSTCDADHDYRQARVPAGRRKKDPGVLEAEPASGAPRARRPDSLDIEPATVDSEVTVLEVATLEVATRESTALDVAGAESLAADSVAAMASDVLMVDLASDELEPVESREDDGPVHRRLIRATLPRPEGQVPERKEPEFTVRQQGGRGREIDGNRAPQHQRRPHRPLRGGGAFGDARMAGSGNGNRRGGHGSAGNHGHGNGRPPQGQPGAGANGQGRPGRSRRRRGR